jgi:undecaprenyl-diphosphatase
MSFLKALLLGIIHGLTEFLGLSASGHFIILQDILKLDNSDGSLMFFNAMLHLGTLIAAIVYYRRELKAMTLELLSVILGKSKGGRDEKGRKLPNLRMTIMLIVATVPLLLFLVIRNYIEPLYSNITFVGFAVLVTGMLLFISDKIQPGRKKSRNVTLLDALFIGLAQLVSVVPGLSRSAATIVVGMTRGLNREFSVKFSFLLSIPAVFGLVILEIMRSVRAGITWSMAPMFIAGMVLAAVVGFFAIGFVRSLVEKTKLSRLSYYCWIVGGITLIVSVFM